MYSALYRAEYVSVEELLEILAGNSNVHVIVYLNSYSYSVALTNAEATGENYVVLYVMLLYCSLK